MRTNELQRKKLEKYLTNSKVRLVRTNELQLQKVLGVQPDDLGCASCAPMNYNVVSCGGAKKCGPVRLVYAHELQQAVDNRPPNRAPVRLVRTNELQHAVYGPISDDIGCASCAPTNYNYNAAYIRQLCNPVRSTRTNELQHIVMERKTLYAQVRFVRTNELQRLSAYRHQPARKGASHAHP